MKRHALLIGFSILTGSAGYLLGRTASAESAAAAIRNHQNWRLRIYLMQAGSPNAATEVGSLLDYSLGEKGNDDAALMLIAAGANIDRNGPGLSPLDAAMLACRPAVVSALIDVDRAIKFETLSHALSMGDCPAGRKRIEAAMASDTSLERSRER